MTPELDAYRPGRSGATALFLDTSGLFAYFHPDAAEHGVASEFVDRIADGTIPYRPLLTSTYVVDELVTLLQSRGRVAWAIEAYDTLMASESITVLDETDEAFETAGERLGSYRDHGISFTDHLNAVLMEREHVDHVFAYDDDYNQFGLTVVPR